MKIQNHTLPKAIRRHSIRLWLATAIATTATLATLTGCSADNDPQIAAGGDGTSVTFGATIAPREAHGNDKAPASRAIIDGTFEDGDRILVHMDGKLKAFVYRTAQGFVHDGSVSNPGTDTTPAEWKSGETQKDLLAYGPAKAIVSDANAGFVYQCFAAEDQSSGDDYKNSDYVYTAQTLHRSDPALTFRHGMTRIVVRLRSGGSLKDEDVAGATVLLGNENLLTVADIDPQTGTLTAHVPAGANERQPQTITPHRCADAAPAGFVAVHEALLPPQDVSGKSFIRVLLSDGRELGYAAESGSLLKGGHEYVYNVTVKEDHVTVTISDGDVPWQDGILTTEIDGKEFRLIRTAEDLARFARDVNGDGVSSSTAQPELNALQTADIDLQDLARSTDPDLQKLAENWVPIGGTIRTATGGYTSRYAGIYCGNGYTVSGLRIKSRDEDFNGLFGNTNKLALLTGIHLRDVRITGTIFGNTGALAGYVGGGTITLCSAEGTIDVTSSPGVNTYLGGLVGYASDCSINRCRTKVDIKADVPLKNADGIYAGGIVGGNTASSNASISTLFTCRAEGSVSLTGMGTSENPYSLCAGGIAGYNGYIGNGTAAIYACMATGDVSIDYQSTGSVYAYAGGLVGYNGKSGDLEYSYARGTASGYMTTSSSSGNKSKAYYGAIIGGRNGSDPIIYCFGAGAGGAGTSGLKALTGRIVYNEAPRDGEIRTVIGKVDTFPISTTLYDANATPAYGISIVRRQMEFFRVWSDTDPIWPASDMEYNGGVN